ncbi:transcriptional regulator [Caulobacter sp. D5]|uniref:helix-turn-helix domain-containing protein n=1 Tax=Caulobacter sp. D5 TaxID=357400 RepID=UPI000D73BD9C|nr:helix-turn-helix domain-containing protein [Caulobacter sp. D5]PXA95096.1 transcriptional regulator [Caulobacter sp. D5]
MPPRNPPHPVDKHVGAKIRLRRKSLGISQAKLALGLNLTFQQIQKYERGANRISASMLYRLAGVLRAQPAWFFEGLPATDAEEAPSTAQMEKAQAITALLASPDGIALAQLLSGLEPNRRRKILGLMAALGPPADQDEAA